MTNQYTNLDVLSGAILSFLSCSISDVHLESSCSGGSGDGRPTKSSLSVESGGSSSRGGGGSHIWTPPAGSAEGSTPTWTEGTPSFTESSSSGDIGKCLYALHVYYATTWRHLQLLLLTEKGSTKHPTLLYIMHKLWFVFVLFYSVFFFFFFWTLCTVSVLRYKMFYNTRVSEMMYICIRELCRYRRKTLLNQKL